MLLRAIVSVVLVGLALVACGPSSGQIRTARTARYHTTASAAFQAGVAALTQNGYKVANADPVLAKALTTGRWYESDGTFAMKGGDDLVIQQEGMIFLTLAIAVVPDGDAFRVEVTPHGLQHRAGYSAGFPLKPSDPSMSGWITGKVDNVYLSVHEALKKDAVAPGT